jgi:hypothetical protein
VALHCTDSFKLSDRYFILTEAGRMQIGEERNTCVQPGVKVATGG